MKTATPPSPPSLETQAPELQGTLRLQDWGVIRASGEEAAKFLHGQLTQDIEHLQAGQARLAGFCSVKGRLLATFVVWRPAPDTVLLACSADLLTSVLKRLSMFVLRAKCKLSDASADLPVWGLAGPVAEAALGDAAPALPWGQTSQASGTVVRLPPAGDGHAAVARFLFIGAAPPALPALPVEAWRWLEVHSAVARVVAATTEQFVPQMVNFELVGGVSFQKGCFPGQEIVARSQYRGTVKRRSQVMYSPEALAPGQEVFHTADPEQPAGLVVLAGADGGGHYAALVEIKLAALVDGSLHSGSATGPRLTLGSLPYAIPTEPT